MTLPGRDATDDVAAALVRVNHPALSLWQSTVRQVVATHVAGGDINAPAVGIHHLVREADAYVYQHAASGEDVAVPALESVTRDEHGLFGIALAHAHDVLNRLGGFADSIGRFDNLDPLFIECLFEFVKYYWLASRMPQYRDWKKEAKGLAFGLVTDPIPSGARIALIGDWGTGLADAESLLEQLLVSQRPDVLFHLGDVYYSGTPAESQHNFSSVLKDVLARHPELGSGPRVYAIPGNHDYYAGGAGFYNLIDELNAPTARQEASYVCLRTADGAFQLLGMDTGYNDREPGLAFDSRYTAPVPQASEVEWLQDKLEHFDGGTILLSHHQAFSSHASLNGPESGVPAFINQPLIDCLGTAAGQAAAWFWGHEHNLVLFENAQHGVGRGRLVGCSAFEMTPGDDPYKANFPEVAVQPPRLGKTGNWYNHGCAVIDLGARSITYYELAAWAATEPQPAPKLSEIVTEAL